MSDHLITIEDARRNLLSCAAFMAERLRSADGKADAMQHIVPLYIVRGDVDTAAGLSDGVEDPLTRDRLLIAVAEKCADVGDDAYGFQLAEAIEDFSMQSAARERIALQKVAKGQLQEAIAISNELDNPDDVLIAASTATFANEGLPAAVSVLEKMQFAFSRCVALQNFAAVALRKEDKASAVEALESAANEAAEIDFNEERIRARIDLAHNFVDVGRNDRAISVLDDAKRDAESLAGVHRDPLLANVSVAFVRAGSLELADRTLDLVDDKSALVSALSGYASEFSRKGEKEEALATVREAVAIIRSQAEKETRDHRTKFRQWRSLAVQLATFGDGAGGIEVACEIPDGDERMTALAQLHILFVDRAEDALAEEALSEIPDAFQKAFAIVGAADIDIRDGRRERAVERIGDALGLLKEIEQPVAKSSLMTECVRRFLEIGENEKARACGLVNCRVILGILDESIRAASLAGLAGVYESQKLDANAEEAEVLASMMAKL